MKVNRRIFTVKKGNLDELVALVMAENKRISHPPTILHVWG
jgi:hypothetical protein